MISRKQTHVEHAQDFMGLEGPNTGNGAELSDGHVLLIL